MIVKLPDGKIAKFPDNMSAEEVQAVLQKQYNPDMSAPISTVTGQPVPSAEEKISRGNEMIRTAGPIIGDIALSAVMPQKRIAEGAGLAAKLGIKGLNLLMRSGGAGVGSAVGDIAAQKITSDQPVDMGSAGKQAVLGATGEVVSSGVVSGVKGAGSLADKASNVMPGINRMTKMATSVTNKARKKFQEKRLPRRSTSSRTWALVSGQKRRPSQLVMC
jgi:hypothetical protein